MKISKSKWVDLNDDSKENLSSFQWDVCPQSGG